MMMVMLLDVEGTHNSLYAAWEANKMLPFHSPDFTNIKYLHTYP